jgi:phosphonate transport system substrate-binding protein
LGQAAAGGGVQKTLAQQPQEIRSQLRVIYETSRVAPHPVVVHPRVPAQVAQRVRDAFQTLGMSGAGRKLLAAVPITEVGPANLADYAPLREMGLEKYYVVQ